MRRVVVVAAILSVPTLAQAQPISGLYVGAGAGANFLAPMQASGDETKISTTPGVATLGAIGWGFGNGLRVEVEGDYRSNGMSGIETRRVNGALIPLGDVNGGVASYATMVNALYDFDLRRFGWTLRPYLGAGVGYGWISGGNGGGVGFGRFRVPVNNTIIEPDQVSFGTGGAFAYQAIVGVAQPLPVLPGLEVFAEYRYFGTAQANIPVERVGLSSNTINGVTPVSRVFNGFTSSDESILVGLRYVIGTPWVR